MKTIITFVVATLFCFTAGDAWADETLPEKGKVIKNDAARATKKAIHRVEEAVCAKSDAACLAKKAKNRVTETGEALGDKVSETKNKVD